MDRVRDVPEVILSCDSAGLRAEGKRIFLNPKSTDEQRVHILKEVLDHRKRIKLEERDKKKQTESESWEMFFDSYFCHQW